MWSLFKKTPLLSDEDNLFQVECYRWLLTHFGGPNFYQDTELILPTDEFFPVEATSNRHAAETTFEQVKKFAGMGDWPCELKEQDSDIDTRVAPTLAVAGAPRKPLGTFSINDDGSGATITYNPALVSNPTQMVATFAHELAHYLTGTAPSAPPGGWENWEFATDIAATFLGFGVFMANATFNFQQHSDTEVQGWQVSGGGYLSESEHSYSLAIFMLLKGISYDIAAPYCDINIRKLLKSAFVELQKTTIIGELQSVTYESCET